MIVELVSIFAGIGLHQTRYIVDTVQTTDTIKRFSAYGVGWLGVYPLFALYMRLHGMDRRNRQIAGAAYWIAGVMVGIGVFIGYVLDHFWSRGE